MEQKQDKNKLEAQDKSLQSFQKDFQSEKENTVQVPTERIVYLWYKSCCGCGCNDIWLERTVPFGSSLKHGDKAKDLNKSDKVLDSRPNF
jgi:hypothetical protein